MRRVILLLGLLCCLAASGWAAEVQVKAELNPAAFAVDQAAELAIIVNGASNAQPELPVADGLRFRQLGQSQQSVWNNGQFSSSVAFTFSVQAEKEGQYSIGPVKVRADGKDYLTQPLRCTVGPAKGSFSAAAPDTAPLAAEDVGFMRIQPEKETFHIGQIVPFTLKAYFKPGHRIHIKTEPRLTNENFLLQSLDAQPIQQQEQVQGELFTVLTWRGSISALKEGAAPLAMEVNADLMLPTRRGSNSFDQPFMDDPLFDELFSSYTRKEVKFASPDKLVTALPLPAKNRPADFKGAVGTFSLAVAAAPADGKLGEPITLKMKITGSGNFDRVQAPELTDSAGWKVYPPANSFSGKGSKGEKTFEQAIVPVSSSLKAVPPLRFSYFDPAAGDYITLTSEPIPLRLHSAPEQAPAPQPAPPVQPKKRQFVPPAAGEPVQSVLHLQPLYRQRPFQLLIAGAACCSVAGLLLDLRRKRLEHNPGTVRRRQAERQLARDCRAMREAIVAGEQEQFRRHCREAVQHWIGTLWGRNAAAITMNDLREGLPADSPLLPVFARLEASGYALEPLAEREMEVMLQTVRQELVKLA
ncbi:BatD family protein [Candidatus Electronema sp. JM]|uniref:BatD family protein n=1 Tax=Candidatus Electronema sp. JM TaxID=3401571 RepID=UPI003AA9D7EC